LGRGDTPPWLGVQPRGRLGARQNPGDLPYPHRRYDEGLSKGIEGQLAACFLSSPAACLVPLPHRVPLPTPSASGGGVRKALPVLLPVRRAAGRPPDRPVRPRGAGPGTRRERGGGDPPQGAIVRIPPVREVTLRVERFYYFTHTHMCYVPCWAI